MDKKNRYKILLVEDENSIRLAYAEYLRMEGFEVEEASDGEIALKKAFEYPFDLMLLDIMLPKIDGLEVLKRIRIDNKLKNKKVYLLTVLGKDKVITEAFKLGANGYFIKDKMTPEDIKKEILIALEENSKNR